MYNNWCNNATVIFVDAPPGTGFSKAGRTIDLIGNDLHFEREATSFVKQLYNDWPELKPNKLYISGVGFGGVFAPLLALNIHRMNKEWQLYNKTAELINLRGIFVANAIVDYKNGPSSFSIDMLYQYNIIPQSLYDKYV